LDNLAQDGFSPNNEILAQESVMSRLNAEDAVQSAPAIKLENFAVPQPVINTPKIMLGDSGIHFSTRKKIYILNYRKIFIISLICIVVFGAVALIL